MAVHSVEDAGEERPVYTNKIELMLTLVGYAVGFGNIWRFPYLTYTYGGGAFLIPYLLSLALLGLPLFVLELGLGQILRQGTLGVWNRLGLPRLRGVGAAATVCTFYVALYYNVILAWTLFYLGSTITALVHGHGLPWSDMGECPQTVLTVRAEAASSPYLFDAVTGFYNKSHEADFLCPGHGVADVVTVTTRVMECPGEAALAFWRESVLQQSTGLTHLGGIHPGMLAAFTAAWILIYFCILNGVKTSGKVVYVTATLPYVALVAFFFRAMTLPGAKLGVEYFLSPDFSHLADGRVWMNAVTQIFFSLGVGFGSLIAFASYGDRRSNFVADASKVSFINCGTSIFAGLVVFPILSFLTLELSESNPCIKGGDIASLSEVGLSGTGLAFVAFPIAISQMPGGFFWALLFFVMLVCLGIDSQFAMVESIVTVLSDAGVGRSLRKPVLVGMICLVCYLPGLIFVTRGGIYWFDLFNNYSCVIALFFVTLMQCVGLMWVNRSQYPDFKEQVMEATGVKLNMVAEVCWKFVCPLLILAVSVLSIETWDVMGAKESKPFPEGTGYFPAWSIWLGWAMGLSPIAVAVVFAVLPPGGSPYEDGRDVKPSSQHAAQAHDAPVVAHGACQTAPGAAADTTNSMA